MALFFSPTGPAFYDNTLPVPIPSNAIEVTESERQALLSAINSGGSFELVAGKPLAVPPPHENIAVIKAALKQNIDAAAETERLKYITAGTGQAMTYQRKVDEAKQAIGETNPKPADYPLLAASIGIDGENLKAVASVILGMDAAWAQIGAQIERIRLTAKQDVDAAEDEASARSVIASIVWQLR